MRVVIVGAGTMGQYLADELSREGHNVYLIDKDPSRVAEARESLDVMAVEDEALDGRVIREASLADADMLLAVTNSDEQNIVIAGLAREYGVGLVAARVRDDFYSLPEAERLLTGCLKIDEIINPDDAATTHMLGLITVPGSLEVFHLAGGRALLATFPVHGDCPAAGKKLSQMGQTPFDGRFPLAAAVYRSGTIVVPRGGTELRKGDEASFIMLRGEAAEFGEWFVPGAKPSKRVMILGAESIGVKLAARLEAADISVTLLDPDHKRCLAASAMLEKSTVLRGHITEREVASDTDFSTIDYLVAATSDEEDNIVSAFLAKELGIKRTMVVTQRAEYVHMLRRLRIDSVVNPRILAAGEVLRFIRKGIVLSVAKVGDDRPGGAEILEFMVSPSSPIAGKKLKEAGLHPGTLVGLIIEDGKPLVPHGDTEIKPGQRVLVFSVKEALKAVQKTFAPQ